jgi:ABC-2 type transport system ATP-binding protein
MPEERGLYKNMSVGDQILYFGELKGMSKNDALNEAKNGLTNLISTNGGRKNCLNFLKGWHRKYSLCNRTSQTSSFDPDEPFSGFDPVNANLIKDQIIDLKNNGTTIILSTHRMESVEEMCDYVALINNSKKIIDGRVFDVREKFKKNILELRFLKSTMINLKVSKINMIFSTYPMKIILFL